jgi:hypothetical protein
LKKADFCKLTIAACLHFFCIGARKARTAALTIWDMCQPTSLIQRVKNLVIIYKSLEFTGLFYLCIYLQIKWHNLAYFASEDNAAETQS